MYPTLYVGGLVGVVAGVWLASLSSSSVSVGTHMERNPILFATDRRRYCYAAHDRHAARLMTDRVKELGFGHVAVRAAHFPQRAQRLGRCHEMVRLNSQYGEACDIIFA